MRRTPVLPQVHHVARRDTHRRRAVPAVVVPLDKAGVRQHRPGELRRQNVRRDRHAAGPTLAHVQVRSTGHLLEPEDLVQPHRARVDRVRVVDQVEHGMVEHLFDLVARSTGVRRCLADERLDAAAVGGVLQRATVRHLAAGLGHANADLAEQPKGLTRKHCGVDRRRPIGRARDASGDQFVVAARVLVVAARRGLACHKRRTDPRTRNSAVVRFDGRGCCLG